MTPRMKKLEECLAIAIKHKNKFLEENIREAIKQELENPTYS